MIHQNKVVSIPGGFFKGFESACRFVDRDIKRFEESFDHFSVYGIVINYENPGIFRMEKLRANSQGIDHRHTGTEIHIFIPDKRSKTGNQERFEEETDTGVLSAANKV